MIATHPVLLRKQEPRATNGALHNPGLLPSQEHKRGTAR